MCGCFSLRQKRVHTGCDVIAMHGYKNSAERHGGAFSIEIQSSQKFVFCPHSSLSAWYTPGKGDKHQPRCRDRPDILFRGQRVSELAFV